MISPKETGGSGTGPAFSVRDIMRLMEKELAKEQGAFSDQAQQLFYDAMEAATEQKQRALLKKALELDPGNVDALLVVLHRVPLTLEEEIEALRKILALAERRLGPQTFKELAGAFWGFIETRPYMRARAQLAEAMRQAGRIEEAIAEWEAMLKLNPNDNQGVRYTLLACYLALHRLDEARKLFEKYDERNYNTVFAWGWVLERFLSGDRAEAEKALAVARKQNPHTEAYLKEHRQVPKNQPDSYAPGSQNEAICFADALLMAWGRHAEAQQWLAGQASPRPGRRGKKKG
ncbi:tetratricopeptide repeat protein [bacterium]|nr:MAG: tetratricopeptide repeat protein [bacterium]